MATKKRIKQTAFTTPLWKVAANEGAGTVLTEQRGVMFRKGYAYAADGYMLIRQTMIVHNIENASFLNGKALSPENYRKIMSYPTATADIAGVETPDGIIYPYMPDEIDKVHDKLVKVLEQHIEGVLAVGGDGIAVNTIGLKPAQIMLVHECLKGDAVSLRFEFNGEVGWILVTKCREELEPYDQLAVIGSYKLDTRKNYVPTK